MPTYEYLCQNCGKPFDIFMPLSEYGKRKVKCAHCGSTQGATPHDPHPRRPLGGKPDG